MEVSITTALGAPFPREAIKVKQVPNQPLVVERTGPVALPGIPAHRVAHHSRLVKVVNTCLDHASLAPAQLFTQLGAEHRLARGGRSVGVGCGHEGCGATSAVEISIPGHLQSRWAPCVRVQGPGQGQLPRESYGPGNT